MSKFFVSLGSFLLVAYCTTITNADEAAKASPPNDVLLTVEKIVKGTTKYFSDVYISAPNESEYVFRYIASCAPVAEFPCEIFPTLGFFQLSSGGGAGDWLVLSPGYLTQDSVIKEPAQKESETEKLEPKMAAVVLAAASGKLNVDLTNSQMRVFQDTSEKYLCISRDISQEGRHYGKLKILFAPYKNRYVLYRVSWCSTWMNLKDFGEKFKDIPRDVLLDPYNVTRRTNLGKSGE